MKGNSVESQVPAKRSTHVDGNFPVPRPAMPLEFTGERMTNAVEGQIDHFASKGMANPTAGAVGRAFARVCQFCSLKQSAWAAFFSSVVSSDQFFVEDAGAAAVLDSQLAWDHPRV